RHLAGRLEDLGPLSILDFGLPILDSAPGRPVGRFGPAFHFGFWIADFGFGSWQAGWRIWARSPFWILDCRFWIRLLAGRLEDLGPLQAGKFDWADGPEGWLRIPCITSVRRHQD